MTDIDVERTKEEVQQASQPLRTLTDEIGRVVVGQDDMIRGLLIGLLSGGHVLLEGVPGLAKTLTISTLAQALDATYQRIQFTPDLLPADIVGTLIYNPKEGTFTPRRGPVFANLILADEVNRAPAKVQAALLESMQERQVTIGDETYPLPDPFLVLATQNPIEQEGTYPLPEAQVDRFMLKLQIGYPTKDDERVILDRMATTAAPEPVTPVTTLDQIRRARNAANNIFIDDRIKDYIVDIVHATRKPSEYDIDAARLIQFGASPRATIGLTVAARAHAFLEGRAYVSPHDVKTVAPDILRHRVLVTYEAEAEEITPDLLVRQILDRVPVP